MRVALYVRVSTEEQKQHGLSVDNQIQALEDYARENNHVVAGLYSDAGISARKSYKKRPALLKLLEDCKAKKIDLILFTKLDRWFRSVGDYYEVQAILEANSVVWRAIWEDYETVTSSGVFKVNIMLSVAQSEADRTSERIRSIFEYKRSQGQVVSGATAIGYVIKDKKWVKDENQRESVEAFFKHYLSTFKYSESYSIAVAKGLKSSYRASMSFIQNECYFGKASYITEGYITEEQYKLIQKNRERHPKTNKNDYIFRGVCICGLCGSSMSGKLTAYKNAKGQRLVYKSYICCRQSHGYDCAGSTIKEENIERYLLDNLDKELNKYNVLLKAERSTYDEKLIASIRGKLTRIKNLYELGDMDFEEYKTKRENLQAELKKIDAVQQAQLITMPNNWIEIYNELDTAHKNAFWISTLHHLEITGRKAKEPTIFFS